MKNQGTWVMRRCLVQHFRPVVVSSRRISQDTGVRPSAPVVSPNADVTGDLQPLRPCQRDCLAACAKGARIIEMACGTGKTRVIQELVSNVSGRVPLVVDSNQFRLIPIPLILVFRPLFNLFC